MTDRQEIKQVRIELSEVFWFASVSFYKLIIHHEVNFNENNRESLKDNRKTD